MRFTVFTPTYNRAATLHRVYESLTRQTIGFEHFEWLIVDDGSDDDTRDLVERWTSEAPFAIRYVFQENGGKHRAWNRGVSDAHGELFAFLDSDDGCVDDALSRVWLSWSNVPEARRPAFAGVMARCRYVEGGLVGEPLPPSVREADFAELTIRHGLRGESWHVTRRDVLANNPFPPGRRGQLVPEGTLWHRIRLPWVVLDEPLRVYYTGDEHGRGDQLSRDRSLTKAAPGMVLVHGSVLENSFRYFRDAPLSFARSAVHYSRFSLIAGEPVAKNIRALGEPRARALCWAMLPAACALYTIDRARGRT